MRISDWSSDVCSSDLIGPLLRLLFVTKNLSQFRHFLGPFKRCAVPCRRHALSMIPFHPCRIPRSEEHTSELQSLMRISYAVFCLKKKKTKKALIESEHKTIMHCKLKHHTQQIQA